MTRAEQRKQLIDEAIDMVSELDYLEYKLPTVLDKLRKLKPTKKEIEAYELKTLFDTYI